MPGQVEASLARQVLVVQSLLQVPSVHWVWGFVWSSHWAGHQGIVSVGHVVKGLVGSPQLLL
jgi:hypothetical protein